MLFRTADSGNFRNKIKICLLWKKVPNNFRTIGFGDMHCVRMFVINFISFHLMYNSQKKSLFNQMFNLFFETGGRSTVFKVGGGFEILLRESGGDLRQQNPWFQSTSTFEIFQGTSIGREVSSNTRRWTLPGLQSRSWIKKARFRFAFSKSTRTLKYLKSPLSRIWTITSSFCVM